MRVDGIVSAADSPQHRPLRGMNQLRLSNKLYALKCPMAKLALLQQLGICVPEIFSSKNLEQRLEPLLRQQLQRRVEWQPVQKNRQWPRTIGASRRPQSQPRDS